MKRLLLTVGLCLSIPAAAASENLWNKVKKGASDAGKAVSDTAEDVGTAVTNTAEDVGTAVGNTAKKTGKAIDNAATAVGDTFNSTVEMVSDEETPEATRARIDEVTDEVLNQLLAENPKAQELYDLSYGYAAFDARQLAVLGAAAGYGRGVAVERESDARTYMNMGAGGVGMALGVGGFERKLVILFEDKRRFDDFVLNGYDASAETNAMVGEDNATERAQFVDGRSMFYLGKKGWRVAATLTGTKYWRDADLN